MLITFAHAYRTYTPLLIFMHEVRYAYLHVTQAIGGATASGGGRVPIVSFWVRKMSCMSVMSRHVGLCNTIIIPIQKGAMFFHFANQNVVQYTYFMGRFYCSERLSFIYWLTLTTWSCRLWHAVHQVCACMLQCSKQMCGNKPPSYWLVDTALQNSQTSVKYMLGLKHVNKKEF